MDISKVFEAFKEKIAIRTGIMTEDNVRYYWFVGMLEQDSNLNNYTLEYPYDEVLKRKELDLLYAENDTILCFEMKFHRRSNDTIFPHPDSAGAIFSDINRLPCFMKGCKTKKLIRYFLYVTDDEMHSYLSMNNRRTPPNVEYRKEMKKFYEATQGETFKISYHDSPDTFKKQLKDNGETGSPEIVLCEKADFECNSNFFRNKMCHVRLYQIIDSKSLIL